MSDRELLELAAKAAGLGLHLLRNKTWCDGPGEPEVVTRRAWNPLEDDGDRHRLLIDLRMTLALEPNRGGWSVGAIVNGEFKWLAFHEDEAQAIVRAAAEIGRSMP